MIWSPKINDNTEFNDSPNVNDSSKVNVNDSPKVNVIDDNFLVSVYIRPQPFKCQDFH